MTTTTRSSPRMIGSTFALMAALAAGFWAGSPAPARAEWWGYCGGSPLIAASWGFCESSMQTACDGLAARLYRPLLQIEPVLRAPNGEIYLAHCRIPHGPTTITQTTVLECAPGMGFAPWYSNGCMTQIPGETLGKVDCPVSTTEPAADKDTRQTFFENPINITTGNKYQRAVDFQAAGPGRLRFVRSYNSMDTGSGVMGGTWRSNFEGRLLFLTSTKTQVRRPDGQDITYIKVSGLWQAELLDRVGRLETDGTTWSYTAGNDTVETFDAAGQLTQITARDGYGQTLAYDAAGQLISVTDSYGRQLGFAYTDGLLVEMTDPDGRITRYIYDRAIALLEFPNRLKAVAHPDGTPFDPDDDPTVTYLYEDAALPKSLTGITDANGDRFATYAYDAEGRAISTEHAGGAGRVDVAYNGDGTVTVTNALGKQSIHTFATVQGTLKSTEIDGLASANCPAASAATTYDANGFVATSTDWAGNQTSYSHDAAGLELSRTEAVGSGQERTITTDWHATWRLPSQIVAPGRTTDFIYDASGRLATLTVTDTTSHTDPYSTNGETRTWGYGYTATGLLATVDGPRAGIGDTTTFTYDAAGNRTKVANALGHETEITAHDPSGRPLTIIDPNGVRSDLAYDARGRLAQRIVVGADGDAATDFTYDPAGQVSRVTLADGSYLDYSYDAAHRVVAVENGQGERIEYARDAKGNVTQEDVKSAGGLIKQTQSRVFDELGRLLDQVGAGAQTASLAWDVNSNPTQATDPLGHTTDFAYDALDRLVTATAPVLAADPGGNRDAVIVFDDRDNQTQVTDQRLVDTLYTYNGFGEVIQVDSLDAGVTIFQRDPAGNPTQVTDGRGVVADLSYDDLDRPVAKTFPASPAEDVTYTYDDPTAGAHGIGRLAAIADQSGSTAFTYDARGNTTRDRRTIDGIVYDTDYGYDLADNLNRIVYPSGHVVAYGRDGLGRVATITVADDATAPPVVLAAGATYQPFGPLGGFRFGNGLDVAYSYDQDYRLTDIVTDDGGAAVQDLALVYDLAGNITAITDLADAARTKLLAYDERDRLIGTDIGAGAEIIDFSYDQVGNRLTRDDSIDDVDLTYAISSNRLQSTLAAVSGASRTFAYDGAGNTTTETRSDGPDRVFVYNDAGRLESVDLDGATAAEYRLNALGQRVMKTTNGGLDIRHFHYDGAGQLIAESDGAGTFLSAYVWLGGLPIAEILPGSVSGTPDAASVDNDDAATSSAGSWIAATAGAGFEGADYLEPAAAPAVPAGGELIDNGDAGFATVGSWIWNSATAGSGFEGADYLVGDHASVPGPFLIDNADPEFSATGSWQTSTWPNGGAFEGADFIYLETASAPPVPPASPLAIITVDNTDAGFSTTGTWQTSTWTGGGQFEGADFTWQAAGAAPPAAIVVDNTDAEFTTNGDWTTSTWSGGGAYQGTNYLNLVYLNTPPNGEVVDQGDSGFAMVGSWTASTSASDGKYYGADWLWIAAGTGANTLTWTPDVPASGSYEIYASWTADNAHATNATYRITHAGGSTDITVDQTWAYGKNRWNLLGTYSLDPAQGHKVELSDDGNGKLSGDAIKVVAAGAEPTTAVWTPVIAETLEYDVYARWSEDFKRSPAATYTIHHSGGSTDVTLDQRYYGGQWHLLGRFQMAPASDHRVELPDLDDHQLIADAIQFVPVAVPAATAVWTPDIQVWSLYDVHAKWSADATRSATARYTVSHAGGSTEIVVDQTAGGGVWSLLGSFQLEPGQGHGVMLADDPDGEVAADAIRFTPVAGPAPATITVDNSDPGFSTNGEWLTDSWPGGGAFEGENFRKLVHLNPTPGATAADTFVTDNGPPGTPGFSVVGSWSTSPQVSDGKYYGTDWIWNPAGTGANIAIWTPTIAASGSFDVYASWPADNAHATDATFTITHAGGSTDVVVDQTYAYSRDHWNHLGSFTFDPAAGHKIELSDLANGIVAGDAIQVIPAGTTPTTAVWTPALQQSYFYDVAAKWSAKFSRPAAASYTIHHAGGATDVVLNQTADGGTWNLLGQFEMHPGQNHRVELPDLDDYELVADAIRFTPVGPALPPPPPAQPPSSYVVDNTDPGFSTNGQWLTSTTTTGGAFEGADHLVLAYLNPPANAELIDNTSAGFASTGTWTASASILNGSFYGADWLSAPAGSGAATVTWTPTIATSGSYDVHASWTIHSGRASDATYTITHAGGSTAVVKTQRPTSTRHKWNHLGAFTFDPGQGHKIVLTDDANGVVAVDAITVTPVGAAPTTATWTPEIGASGSHDVYARWTDNGTGTRTTAATYTIHHAGGSTDVVWNQRINGGTWNQLGTFQMDPGQNHRIELPDLDNATLAADAVQVTPVGAVPATATWTPEITVASIYEVYAKWSAVVYRSPTASYTIHHAGGTTQVVVDQRSNGGVWNLLGSFEMAPASGHRVELIDADDGEVVADAIQFTPVDYADPKATWTPAIAASGSYDIYASWVAQPGRSADATYTVTHAGGTTNVQANHRVATANGWHFLGSFTMDPAAGHQVHLAADPDETVAADAIYVVATPAPGPTAVFTWLPVVPASGAYKIYANWPADAARPTAATYTVTHAGGTTPVVVNQRQNGGQWHLLGTYTLTPGQNHGVDLESSTSGVVAADAIRIVADSATPQNVAYVHADHLTTPQKMTDPSGTVIWDRDALPFGQTASLTGTGELPLRFPGQYYDDETGLYYNYFRDYDPSTGRYIQSDPIGLAGGFNIYAYVGGNPINVIDPYGLDAVICQYSCCGGYGHVGIGVNTSQTKGFRPTDAASGFQTVTGGEVPGEISSDIGEDRGEREECTTIPTTPEQDDAMQKFIDLATKHPAPYDLNNRNCVTHVRSVLGAAGIETSQTLLPKVLMNNLKSRNYTPVPNASKR